MKNVSSTLRCVRCNDRHIPREDSRVDITGVLKGVSLYQFVKMIGLTLYSCTRRELCRDKTCGLRESHSNRGESLDSFPRISVNNARRSGK